jgi:hypothetical protein
MTTRSDVRSPLDQLRRYRKEELPQALREQILAVGAAAVPTLVEILDGGRSWAPVHAARLLGELKEPAAAEALIRKLARVEGDDPLFSAIVFALSDLDEPAIEPMLAAHESSTAAEFRLALREAMSGCGAKDERVFELLLASLEEERRTRAFGISAADLAEYGDPRAIGPLVATLDELDPADDTIDEQIFFELEDAIETLGGALTEQQAGKVAAARVKRRALFAPRPRSMQPARKPDLPERNDPCWCESGRKYKKCHLAADDAARLASRRPGAGLQARP